MSGIFSVPFVALAAFNVASMPALWIVMAVLAPSPSAYVLWKNERERVVQLENAANPRVRIEFGKGEPFAYTAKGRSGADFRCYRFRVTNVGLTPLGSCKAQIGKSFNDAGDQIVGILFSLQRSHSGTETFPLRPDEEKFVDLVAVPLAPYANRPAKIAAWGESWPDFAQTTGTALPRKPCTLNIQVLSEAPASKISMRFEPVNGEWILRAA
jgi:hypothetical protein